MERARQIYLEKKMFEEEEENSRMQEDYYKSNTSNLLRTGMRFRPRVEPLNME